jgi:hypothetical protein
MVGSFAMIKGWIAIGSAAALCIAATLLMPAVVNAKGFGSHHSFGPMMFGHAPARHHHAFGHRRDPFAGYGYVMPAAYIEPNTDEFASVRTIVLSPAIRCSHSRDTVTVPSEDGGTREITITRC